MKHLEQRDGVNSYRETIRHLKQRERGKLRSWFGKCKTLETEKEGGKWKMSLETILHKK